MEKENLTYFQAEMELFEISHAQVGAYLLTLWGLQEEIVSAVCNHHIYDNSGNEITADRSVFIANYIAKINTNNFEYIKSHCDNTKDFSWFKP